jgi:hypothetical protein
VACDKYVLRSPFQESISQKSITVNDVTIGSRRTDRASAAAEGALHRRTSK